MEARQQRFMYDKRLSWGARVLLSEISKYYGTPVDCEDCDIYFATLFDVSDRQIRTWKSELKNLGYIESKKNGLNKRVLEYKPDLSAHDLESGNMGVIYRTADGKLLTNTMEAFVYFDDLIEKQQANLGKTANALRIVYHTLANSLFDERFYNISFSGFVITYEFLQYLVEHLRIDVVFSTAQRIVRNYAKIQNLNLYVLSSLTNLYKSEFELAKKNPNYVKDREDFRREAELYWKTNKQLSKEKEG